LLLHQSAAKLGMVGFSNDKLLAHFLRPDGEIALTACCAFIAAMGEK